MRVDGASVRFGRDRRGPALIAGISVSSALGGWPPGASPSGSRRRRFGRLAVHDLVVAMRRGGGCGCGRDAGASGDRLVIGGAVGAFFLVDQRLPVGDRNLVVVGMDFAERQKAMAIAAVIDEGGLQRRLDARHFREIDIAS